MIFHAYHGLDDEERVNGQRFEVDVEMSFDSTRAATSDRIRDTIDVRQVYHHVREVIIQDRYFLIESISQHIASRLLTHFDIEEVQVKVRKPFAPIGGLANGTEIEIIRRRDN